MTPIMTLTNLLGALPRVRARLAARETALVAGIPSFTRAECSLAGGPSGSPLYVCCDDLGSSIEVNVDLLRSDRIQHMRFQIDCPSGSTSRENRAHLISAITARYRLGSHSPVTIDDTLRQMVVRGAHAPDPTLRVAQLVDFIFMYRPPAVAADLLARIELSHRQGFQVPTTMHESAAAIDASGYQGDRIARYLWLHRALACPSPTIDTFPNPVDLPKVLGTASRTFPKSTVKAVADAVDASHPLHGPISNLVETSVEQVCRELALHPPAGSRFAVLAPTSARIATSKGLPRP